MLAARQGRERLARLGKTGGGGEGGVRDDDDVLLLSMTQSAEPNFFLASAPIRLNRANRWCMTLPSALVGDCTTLDAVAADADGDGPPSTHEVPPSGISVTFTSAKSCRHTRKTLSDATERKRKSVRALSY